jgi:hypothetical protein
MIAMSGVRSPCRIKITRILAKYIPLGTLAHPAMISQETARFHSPTTLASRGIMVSSIKNAAHFAATVLLPDSGSKGGYGLQGQMRPKGKARMKLNAYATSGSSPGKQVRSDFHLFSDVPHPTIYLLTPNSKPACAWVADHIPDDAMWFGSSIVVEHRYCAALVAQIERDGLRVSR